MATLPKGITTTSYKTKKGTVLKFQVRFQDGKFKTCKTFEKYESALNYLAECKTAYGKWQIDEKSLFAKALQENMYLKDLRFYMQEHFKYRYDQLDLENELQKKRYSQLRSVYKSIAETEIDFTSLKSYDNISVFTTYQKYNKKSMPMGDMKVHEISPNVINSFIKSKLADGLKKISILTYLTLISNFFKELKYINEALGNIPNPTLDYDKKLLKDAKKRTAKVISESNIERLSNELLKSTNKDVFWIFRLCIATAMRRSEAIFLEWEDIENNVISLKKTKSGEDGRIIYLTVEAQNILAGLRAISVNHTGRIFNTSINAFERVFRLSVLRLGLNKQVNFHMTRKTGISNLFDKLGDNGILVASILGFSEPEKLTKSHFIPLAANTEKSILNQIGHKDGATTIRSYLKIKKDNI